MSNWRSETIRNFIKQNAVLYSVYLMFLEEHCAFQVDSDQSMFIFVLWYLVHGRSIYTIPIVIDERLKSAISLPDNNLCHPLMQYLARQNNLLLTDDEIRARYYFDCLRDYRLAALLSREEILALSRPSRKQSKVQDLQFLLDVQHKSGNGWRGRLDFADCLNQLVAGASKVTSLPSVSIVGFHRSVLGIGEDARCLFECLLELGVNAELVDVSPPGLAADDLLARYQPFEVSRPSASIVIFCLPAFEMMRVIGTLNLHSHEPLQYKIGYWPWETTELPRQWRHVFDFVDEIWASSTFLKKVYESHTEKPVTHMPLHVYVDVPVVPRDLKPIFKDKFTFLTLFDFNSRISRKNPEGSIEAFRRAFSAETDVQLVLKTLHGENRPDDVQKIRKAIGDDFRIIMIDGALSKNEVNGLVAMSDVFLSLHRAEGFGRPLVEAMLLGTPVIATQWSGSADFISDKTALPVGHTLRPVRDKEYPFAAGSWAEPNISEASFQMKRAYEKRCPTSVAARNIAENQFSRSRVAGLLHDRLSVIKMLGSSFGSA